MSPSFWTFMVGLAMTIGLSEWTWKESLANDAVRFRNNVENLRQEFETRVEKYEQCLETVADWCVMNETPSMVQWDNRMERTNIRVNYPGMTEIAYAPAMNTYNGNKERWQNRYPDHWPPPETWQTDAFPVWYQTFQGPAKPQDWGRPLRSTLTKSMHDLYVIFQSRGVRSTRRLLIPSEQVDQVLPAWMFVLAAHRTDIPRSTRDGLGYDADEDLKGFPKPRDSQIQMASVGLVAGTICMEPFLDSIFGSRELEIDFDIYAGPVSETNRMTRLNLSPVQEKQGELFIDLELPWYIDRWHILAVPNDLHYSHSGRSRAWILFAAGCILSTSIFITIKIQEKARGSSEALAHGLEQARSELREVHDSRVRLERDLHDGVLQTLYASVLGLKRSLRLIRKQPESAVPIIREVTRELDEAMNDIRRHLSRKIPDEFSSAHLSEMLLGLTNVYNRSGETEVILSFNKAVTEHLTAEQSEQIFNSIREAVSNAHRHGGASKIHINFDIHQDEIAVAIKDNGRGFDRDLELQKGRGLRNMQQRTELCGGSLVINSRPGGPTSIEMSIPKSGRDV